MREFVKISASRRFALLAPALLALSLTAGGTGAARAQDERPPAPAEPRGARQQQEGRAPRRGDGAGGLLRALNLTPEQRAQIAAIRRETEPQGRQLAARLRQARRALDGAIYADNADDARIEELVREVGAAQVALMRLRTFTEVRIRRILSPEQLNAFRRLQRRARQRMNQPPPPPGDFPSGDAPERPGNRMQRRRPEPK